MDPGLEGGIAHLSKKMEGPSTRKRTLSYFILIDVDNFKNINDPTVMKSAMRY
jgi:GGDEF domain-containing protein